MDCDHMIGMFEDFACCGGTYIVELSTYVKTQWYDIVFFDYCPKCGVKLPKKEEP